MADRPYDAGVAESTQLSYGRRLLDRAIVRRRSLLRKLAIGDAIGERPETVLPRDLRRRKSI